MGRVLAWAPAAVATAVLGALAAIADGPPEGGCPRGPAGTTITFNIKVDRGEKEAIEELLARFEDRTSTRVDLDVVARARRQAGVEVLRSAVPPSELADRLEADLGSGRPTIHLFAQDNLALSELIDNELVQDISAVRIPQEVKPSMIPAPVNDMQFFLPFRPNVQLVYAERSALTEAGFAELPRTVAELREVAEAMKRDAGGRPMVTLSLAPGDPAAVTISEWILAFGGDPLELNGPGSVQAFESLRDLWQDGLLTNSSLVARYDTQVAYLATGESALSRNWSFTSAELRKQDLLERFVVGDGWAGPHGKHHVIGGDVLGVPAGVEGPELEASLALACWLLSREAQELLVNRNAWAAIRDDAYGGVVEGQQDTFAAIRSALKEGWYRPNTPSWPTVSDEMNEALERILGIRGQSEPAQEVLDQAQAEIERARAGAPGGSSSPPRRQSH